MRHIPKMNTKNLGEKRSRHEAQPEKIIQEERLENIFAVMKYPHGHMHGDETMLGKRTAAQAIAMPKKSLLEAADEQ